ncbi:MAG: hypothetical protein HYY06_18950 [Deltaproteobacteria bacterium]|nr:hypothetical protein [Deltaproteobacteria bacterium]
MAQEQLSLTAAFSALFDELGRPPDSDGDGQPDLPVPIDVHVGVISGDMGSGGYAVTSCSNPITGDDGVLQSQPARGLAGCEEQYPRFLSWAEGDDPSALSAAFECAARLGTDGCPFQQPLAAARKALTMHASGANAGFLRDDSVLALIFVTTHDDCSVRSDDPRATDLFNSQLDLGPLGLRCFTLADDYLEPVDAIAQDLHSLRGDRLDRLVVAAIAGIPRDVDCSPEDFQCLLDDPRMQKVIDESDEGGGDRVVPSCDQPDRGKAFPPRRIVELVADMAREGALAAVHTACASDYGPAMARIGELVASGMRGACLSRPLPLDSEGFASCILEETLFSDDACPPGRIDRGAGPEGRRCQICQRGDGRALLHDEDGRSLDACAPFNDSGDYWEYEVDRICPLTGMIRFRGEALPAPGSVVRIRCFVGECP